MFLIALVVPKSALCQIRNAPHGDGIGPLFQEATRSLRRGAYEEAIDAFESLGDRGYVHPDASFNRGVAYALRAQSPQAQPGDLGRAAAALNETLWLRPEDGEAQAALERVRAEISRRRARQGLDPVVVRPSLFRAAVGLLPEQAWALTAALGAFCLTVGLVFRWLLPQPRVRLAAAICSAAGAFLLVTGGGVALCARHFRLASEPAVVVTAEAPLLDETATPISARAAGAERSSIPEGADVYVLERRGGLYRVEWGTARGWVNASQVRILGAR
jgi:hypothetical protein